MATGQNASQNATKTQRLGQQRHRRVAATVEATRRRRRPDKQRLQGLRAILKERRGRLVVAIVAILLLAVAFTVCYTDNLSNVGTTLSTFWTVVMSSTLATGKTADNRQHSSHRSSSSSVVGLLTDTEVLRLAESADIEVLWRTHLNALLIPRPVGSPGHVAARQHIVNHLRAIGWHVSLDAFEADTPLGVHTFTNVVATLNPGAPRRLVLAAHYDSKILAAAGEVERFVGAHDSAVPCALLLDVADALGEAIKHVTTTSTAAAQEFKNGGSDNAVAGSSRSDTTLELVFFDGEEAFVRWEGTDNTYGARHLAARWQDEGRLKGIDVLVLLDLIGAPDPRIVSSFQETYPQHRLMVRAESRLKQLGQLKGRSDGQPYFTPRMPQRPPLVSDDHVPFLQRGVPILHVM